jgi:two-component system, LuxR family, sensor kinase FixL
MISNGQQSDNRDDIVAEPMDGFSSLRLKQSWYKTQQFGHRGCGTTHAAKPWEGGLVAIGPLFRARRRHAQVPGPIASRRSPYALGPASRIAWYHSSQGIIPDPTTQESRGGRAKRLPQGTQKESTTAMYLTSPTLAFSNWPASRLIAGAIAIIIFAIDTFIPFDIAIAVLYVIVVLMAANFLPRRGVILVSLACVALTVLSYMLQHGYSDGSEPIGRCLVSLTAIGITTVLALERQRSEDARRRSETYLAEAQRLSRTGSFSWKIATEEQYWSEEIFRIYEYDFATKPTLDLVRRRSHPDDASILQQAFVQASSGAQNIDITHRLLMPDGSVKHVKVLAHPARDVADNVEYVGVLMDITAAKQAEEALQEAQASLAHVTRVTALGELTTSIAHEVNQPLAATVTNGDAGLRWLNREVPQLDEVRGAIERMIDCAKHASEVIARLRALSRKSTSEKIRLDINEVVNQVLALIRREISAHQVLVRLDLASSLPSVFGDRVQLQQVVLNLLVNSIQAMALVDDRPRELLIRSRAYNSEHILVEVRDSGVGVDPEHAGRLFNAFFTTKADGMGMGLSICRSIIEAHGGRIWASPNAGPGTIFQFTLPALRADAVQPEGTARHAPV